MAEEKMNIKAKLLAIQTELKAPKKNRNEFAKFNYRSCEDILEAVKPLLSKHKAVLTIEDTIQMVGDRYYVVATAVLEDTETDTGTNEFTEISKAWAREEETKKGMDSAQVTGSASSYARKYALNGLFAIDDTEEPDMQDNTKHVSEPARPATPKSMLKQSVEFAKNWELGNLKIAARKVIGDKPQDEIDAWLEQTLNVPLDKMPHAWVGPALDKLTKMLDNQPVTDKELEDANTGQLL